MAAYRKRLIADPAGFLPLAHALEESGFSYDTDRYKRDRFPDAPEEIKPYINVKSFAWGKHFHEAASLIAPSDIAERLKAEMLTMQPMYGLMHAVIDSVN